MVRRIQGRIHLTRAPWAQAPATAALTLLTIVVSVFIFLSGSLHVASVQAGFLPLRVGVTAGGFWLPWLLTPLSATLVHGGWMHLIFNMVMLVYVGRETERALGATGLGALYVIGAFAAAAGQWIAGPQSQVPMIGASGSISALVGAYALLYGQRRAKAVGPLSAGVAHVLWLAVAWTGIQLLIGATGPAGQPIAIAAHIGGFLAGLAMARPLLLARYRGA